MSLGKHSIDKMRLVCPIEVYISAYQITVNQSVPIENIIPEPSIMNKCATSCSTVDNTNVFVDIKGMQLPRYPSFSGGKNKF